MRTASLPCRATSVQLQGGGRRGPDVSDLPATVRGADRHALWPHVLQGLPSQLLEGQPHVPVGQKTPERDGHTALQSSAEEVRLYLH